MRISSPLRIKLDHPDAYWISIANHEIAYAGPESSEIAFFRQDGSWVVEPIAEFAKYHDGATSDTAVYGWVPNEEIAEFLKKYQS